MTDNPRNVDPKVTTIHATTRVVDRLPYPIEIGSHFHIKGNGQKQYTHSLFTFPAKFHAPIVQWALRNYANENTLILDPFNGSGTVQVEALSSGYDSIGIDIDPVAVFIARAKTRLVDPARLDVLFQQVKAIFSPSRRSNKEYMERKFPAKDLSEEEYLEQIEGLWVPVLPNLFHWFRRYVIVDLATIHAAIQSLEADEAESNFLLAVFASIIRRCSNADPVPVSGLEYTKHMKERDAKGRIIDPFTFFEQKAVKEIDGMRQLWTVRQHNRNAQAIVYAGDTREIDEMVTRLINENFETEREVDLVITSPPYCNAVDYHTRNKLEAYWLQLITTQSEYLEYYHNYIGRRRVKGGKSAGIEEFAIPDLNLMLQRVDERNAEQARNLSKYFSEMRNALERIFAALQPGGHLILFIGDSQSAGFNIATHTYLKEFALQNFTLITEFSYDIKNRFMSYERHNGANIKAEWGIVLRKRTENMR